MITGQSKDLNGNITPYLPANIHYQYYRMIDIHFTLLITTEPMMWLLFAQAGDMYQRRGSIACC